MRCTSRLSSFEARVHLEQRGSLCLHSLAECGLTIPSSGPAPAGFAVLHGPLKSNVSALARSMKKSSVRVLASSCAAFGRPEQLCCIGCTVASVQPGLVRFVTFRCLRLQRFLHRRQRLGTEFLSSSASTSIVSHPKAQNNTLLV